MYQVTKENHLFGSFDRAEERMKLVGKGRQEELVEVLKAPSWATKGGKDCTGLENDFNGQQKV